MPQIKAYIDSNAGSGSGDTGKIITFDEDCTLNVYDGHTNSRNQKIANSFKHVKGTISQNGKEVTINIELTSAMARQSDTKNTSYVWDLLPSTILSKLPKHWVSGHSQPWVDANRLSTGYLEFVNGITVNGVATKLYLDTDGTIKLLFVTGAPGTIMKATGSSTKFYAQIKYNTI